MATITIISGSTLGNAEYVAEHIAELLQQSEHNVQLLHGPNLHQLPLNGIWLIVSSTHGAGDVPDNLKPLLETIATSNPDLSAIQFGGIGLGNSEYDTFCSAIDMIDQQLTQHQAKRIGSLLKIDVKHHDIPEDPAELWFQEWIKLF